jgi:hypothetical protein
MRVQLRRLKNHLPVLAAGVDSSISQQHYQCSSMLENALFRIFYSMLTQKWNVVVYIGLARTVYTHRI